MARPRRVTAPRRRSRQRDDGAAVAITAMIAVGVLLLLILITTRSPGREVAAEVAVQARLPPASAALMHPASIVSVAPARVASATMESDLPLHLRAEAVLVATAPAGRAQVASRQRADPAPTKLPPWRDDPSARHPRGDGDARVISGNLMLPTTMRLLPSVRCDYLIPVDRDGAPLATAADIVALFPYPTEREPIASPLASDLARRYGFTVMAIAFPGMDDVDGSDRSSFYYYPESGSGQAWLDGWRQVRAVAGLPERPLLLFGRSGGGSAAHQFAEAHPEAVAAYGEEAGRVFVAKPRCPAPVLLLHGEFDYVLGESIALERALRGSGVEALRVVFRPGWDMRGAEQGLLTHCMHREHFRLLSHWLAGVADLRLAHGGSLPPTTQWPAFAGKPFPDAAAYTAFRATAPPLERLGTAVVARPAPVTAPRGVVLMLVDEFSVDPLDVIFNAQMLADDGFVCAAASSDIGDPVAALAAALPVADPTGALPVVVAIQGSAKRLPALRALAGSRLRGCAALCDRVDAAAAMQRACPAADPSFLILAPGRVAKAIRAELGSDVTVETLQPKGSGNGRLQLDRTRRLSAWCKRVLATASTQ